MRITWYAEKEAIKPAKRTIYEESTSIVDTASRAFGWLQAMPNGLVDQHFGFLFLAIFYVFIGISFSSTLSNRPVFKMQFDVNRSAIKSLSPLTKIRGRWEEGVGIIR